MAPVMNEIGEAADASLMEARHRDDAHAAERLLARYGGGVYRLAMHITGVSEDAEAATGEALRAAARRIEMAQSESAFGSWLYRTAAKAAYRRLRVRRPEADEVALDAVLPALDADGRHFGPMDDWSDRIDDGKLASELHRVLTDAIDELPADYRTALVLHDLEGMSNPDIAETLGIDPSSVRSRVHRSRLLMRKRLSESLQSA